MTGALELRDWQKDAFRRWSENKRRGIAAVVTGAGKTIFAIHCLREYRRSVPAATVVIVVPTDALLDQWIEEIISILEIPFEELVVLNSRSKIKLSRIHVGIINTVAQIAARHQAPPCFLIVDECHKAASPVFQQIFKLETEASLGLSATPERQYDDGLLQVLIPSLGPIICNYTYKDALRDKLIVPFYLRNVVFEFTKEESYRYNRLTRAIQVTVNRYGLESQETINLLLSRARMSNSSPSRAAIALKIVAMHRDRRILIFHEDLAACDAIHKALLEFGVLAGIYHSRLRMLTECARYSNTGKAGSRSWLAAGRWTRGSMFPRLKSVSSLRLLQPTASESKDWAASCVRPEIRTTLSSTRSWLLLPRSAAWPRKPKT